MSRTSVSTRGNAITITFNDRTMDAYTVDLSRDSAEWLRGALGVELDKSDPVEKKAEELFDVWRLSSSRKWPWASASPRTRKRWLAVARVVLGC